jgi:hypothetical protein
VSGCWRRSGGQAPVVCPGIVEFVQGLVLLRPFLGFFVKCQDIDEDLRVFSCVLLGDAALIDQSLPLFR